MRNSRDDGAAAADPRIGAMTEADLEDVLAIERASFPTPWTRDHFLAELRRAFAQLPVVRDPLGKVIAYASAWELAGELQINDVAVDPVWRRHGLATTILARLIDGARRRGCSRATLEVRPSNVAARDLYESFGFRETGRRRGYYEDSREDAILLSLSFGAS